MDFERRDRFSISPQQYWDLSLDPALRKAANDLSRVKRALLEEISSPGKQTRIFQVDAEDPLPLIAQKALGVAHLSYVETIVAEPETLRETWSVDMGKWADRIRIEGCTQLQPGSDGGCERVVKAQITVAIPLVGRTIEKQILSDLSQSFEKVAELTRRWIRESNPEG